jgi:outer membrane protein
MAGDCGSLETRLGRIASMRNTARRGQISREQNMQRRNHNGLFDESKRMPQSPSTMKWFGILLVAMVSGFSVWAADTNNSATVSTTPPGVPDAIYAELTNSLALETNVPANTRELSLQDCIQLTLQHNIELQIDRYNPQIALYALKGAYAPYDPTAAFSGQHSHSKSGPVFLGTNIIGGTVSDQDSFNTSVGGLLPFGTSYRLVGNTADTVQNDFEIRRNAGAQASITATQPLLKNFWIDGTRLVIRVNKNRLTYSELQLKLQVMQTITALEKGYYDLIYNRENVLVQQKAAELTDRLVMESKKKLEVGALAELDLASAEAQAAQNRAAIIAASSVLGTQERALKLFITDQISEWADVTVVPAGSLTAIPQDFNRQNSWSKALAERPEYQQAKLDAERAGIQLKYDWNQLFPELDVIGTYGYNGSGTVFSGALYDVQQRNRPFYSYGGQISVPLANVGARNTYRADKLTLQQFVLSIKRTERDILIAVDNDVGSLKSDYDAVQATHAQRLYEEQALDAEQKKLDNGKSTTYQVLLVQRDLTSARGAEIQALDTYNKDLAQLSLDEGSTLERLNIDFQVNK